MNCIAHLRRHCVLTLVLCLLSLGFLTACDPEGHRDCAWVLEPEPTLINKADVGYIPVCARNRDTDKQDCRLQTTIEFAEKVLGKTFRYSDLKVLSPGLPRTIDSIRFCKPP